MTTDDRCVTTTADAATAPQALAEQYRSRGWWTGERLADRFRGYVDRDPGRAAVIDDRGTTLTREQLWTRAEELGTRLAGAGVRPGDVVLIYLPNTLHWQVSLLAVLRLGAVPATLPLSTDESTLAYIYDLVAARAVIAPRSSRRRPTGEWALAAVRAAGREGTVLSIADDGAEVWTTVPGERQGPIVPAEVDHLMFTSSTTGMPKAVMHTADTLATVNRQFAERFGLGEDTPLFMPSPLGHSVGAWHGGRLALWTGATLVLQETWDPRQGLELIDRHQCAFTAAATPFLKDIVDVEWPSGQPKMPSVRTFLCGGAPVPPSLMEQAAAQAPDTFVTVLWGMTEGAGTTCTADSTYEQLTGSAGRPLPDLDFQILLPDADGAGELAMRGPQVFVGYLGQEAMYRELLTDDGYFRTGDLARIDEDGYLHLTGRLKDIIIRGGVNISPVPIENAIAAHPDVKRVAVIGQSDERLGERICAVVVPGDHAPSLEELNAWLRDQGVSERKLPESLVVVDDMPVTAAGKIRKVDLRRSLEER